MRYTELVKTRTMEIYLFQLIQLKYDNHQLVSLQHAGSDLSLLFTPLSSNYASSTRYDRQLHPIYSRVRAISIFLQ
jgi:hypothetical protein